MRKRQTPEEIFLDQVNRMIKNFFIDNPNYSNGHYYEDGMGIYELIKSNRRGAEHILEKIEDMKHLIIYDDEE